MKNQENLPANKEIIKDFQRKEILFNSKSIALVHVCLSHQKEQFTSATIKEILRKDKFSDRDLLEIFGKTGNRELDLEIFYLFVKNGKNKNFVKEHVLSLSDLETKKFVLDKYQKFP